MPGAFSSKRNFLFDLDGTLVDSASAHARAYTGALRPGHSRLADSFDYASFAGRSTREVFQALGIADSGLDDLTREKQRLYRAAWEAGEVELFPGAESLLRQLHEKGRRLFLVTGASRISARRVLDTTGLARLFEGVVAAEDAVPGKPSPDPYLHVLAAYGLKAGDCLAVEDGEHGVRSAQAAGIEVVLLHAPLDLPGVFPAKNCAHLADLLLE